MRPRRVAGVLAVLILASGAAWGSGAALAQRGTSPTVRPDLCIQGTGPVCVGAGLQNADAWRQTVVAHARPGDHLRYRIDVRNTGAAASRFLITGTAGRAAFEVRYRAGGEDVTGPVVGGRLTSPSLAPGAALAVTVLVTVHANAPPGARQPIVVRGRATTGERAGDAVKAVVTVPGIRARDVGPVLGLAQRTLSWDFAVGRINADDRPDLVIGSHGTLTIYVNHHHGLRRVFRWHGTDIHGCTTADFSGDGRGDVYCTSGVDHGTIESPNHLWIQTRRGDFVDRAAAFGVEDPLGRGRRTVAMDINGDDLPDLFVGNEYRRRDGRPSPNRTFANHGGTALREVRVGLTAERGALCAHAVDQNGDGRDDLLLCGGLSTVTPGQDPATNHLSLFRRRADGFTDQSRPLGIAYGGAEDARLADFDGDGRLDLAVVTHDDLRVVRGTAGGRFGPVAFRRHLQAGSWIAVGDFDGRHGPDLLVVQGCADGNAEDLLLLHQGGMRFTRLRSPQARTGCGDTAEAIDLDGDGRSEFVVGNGRWDVRGPMQVLTSGMTATG